MRRRFRKEIWRNIGADGGVWEVGREIQAQKNGDGG